MVTMFRKQEKHNGIVGWSDSDWAGCAETRKSTSGGLLCLGEHTVKCWSVTQAVLALSSGEAEFYALVKTASQGLGLRAMLDDLGVGMKLKIMDKKIRIKTDASAARGMALRKGLGPVRHIEVGQLWIQDKVNSGDIGIEKVGGKINLADTLTKHSDAGSLETHIVGTRMEARVGRHHAAPDVAGDEVIENIDWGKNKRVGEPEDTSPVERPDRKCPCQWATGRRCHRPVDLRTGYCGMCSDTGCECSCTQCDPHTSDSEEDHGEGIRKQGKGSQRQGENKRNANEDRPRGTWI